MAREKKQFMKITQKEFMQTVTALAEQEANRKIQMMIGKAHPPGQPGPPNPDPSSPYLPGKSPHKLLVHRNKDGTAHDWREPGHPNLQIPGVHQRPVNPHGRRGTNTWPDGRQRRSPEKEREWQRKIEEYMRQHDTGADEYDFSKSNQGMTIAGQPEFDSFMSRFKKGSSNPKAPSLNHHSPEAQKLILNTGRRIRAM